jgi:hypothetical protein
MSALFVPACSHSARGGSRSLTPIAWVVLAGAILAPASFLAALVELKPRGRTPLAWAYVLGRQHQRPALMVVTRTAAAQRPQRAARR